MWTPSPSHPAYRTLPFWLAFLCVSGLGVFACSSTHTYRPHAVEPLRVIVIPAELEDSVPVCVRVTASMLFEAPNETRGVICLETVGQMRLRAVAVRETN